MPAPAAPSKPESPPAWSEMDLRKSPHDVEDKPQRVRRMFAAIAPAYDLNNRLHSFGRDQAWRRAAVRLASVKQADRVLDVACGTGDLSRAFAQAGAERVTGLDFTEEMLEIARRKQRGGEKIEYIQGDAMALPFQDDSFDVVSIAFGIRNVADPAKALSEFARILRPGGRVIVLEFGRPRNRMIRALNDLYTNSIMPRTATLISRDRSGAYKYLPRSIETFLSREAMVDALLDTGFDEVRVRPMTFGVCVAFRGMVRAAG